MASIRINNVDLNGIRIPKGITVEEFTSWIVGTIGTSNPETFYSVTELSDGYVAIGIEDGTPRKGIIVKYNKDLTVAAQKSISGSGDYVNSYVINSHDGGCVVLGYQDAQGQGNNEGLIIKYDANLNVVAEKSLGGAGNDRYFAGCQSTDGGYITVGLQESSPLGSRDALIVKYDSNLNVVTQKGLGGSAGCLYSRIIKTSDNNYITVGYQDSDSQGLNDGIIAKYDSNLNLLSYKSLGGSQEDYFRHVTETTDGNYVVVGTQDSSASGTRDAVIAKYDTSLNLISQKFFRAGTNDYFRSVVPTSDGGVMVCGYQNSQGQGVYDALIVKYDSNLNVVGQKSLGGNNDDFYRDLIKTQDNGYVLVGYQNSDSEGNYDGIITKISEDLTVINNGTLSNHPNLTWYDSTLSEVSGTLTATSPSLTERTYSFTETTTSGTESTLSMTATRSEKP